MIQFSEKHAEAEDWKLTTKKETSPARQSDTIAPTRKPEEIQEASTYKSLLSGRLNSNSL
ncbi:MAG: hypothetical protein NUV74_15560 [Candidatus Brocadiaceae bacterium]|nr:hypothetical protein [Candidatus Brocadiaceae bacterium]